MPELLRSTLQVFAAQLESLGKGIRALERKLIAWNRSDPTSQRLETIPGVGILTATALSASIENPAAFRSGRDLAAFLGLVPRQNSTGGKPRLGSISRMGNGYLRHLLVVGATSVVRRATRNDTAPWLRALLDRKPARLVTVGVANKTARIVWALMARGGTYQAHFRVSPDPVGVTRPV
nr:IS110 family transposase [Paracoccus sp. S-4012]